MNKITTLLLSGLLILSMQSFAADSSAVSKKSAENSFDTAVKNYDFENYSYNVSDEQLQETVENNSLESDAKASFWSKIINSSHFSSGTATKTYVPINKVE